MKEKQEIVKVIVACLNNEAEPDLWFCKIKTTEQKIENGEHLRYAKYLCEYDNYEAYLAYDEYNSAGRSMDILFIWDSAEIFELK